MSVFQTLYDKIDLLIASNRENVIRRALLLLLIAICLTRLLSIGTYALMDNTESRYPKIDPDLPFLGKPPLSMWATATGLTLFGNNTFAARFPSFVLSLVPLGLICVWGTRFRDRTFGLVCACVLASSLLFFMLSATVMTDPALMATVSLSMVAFAQTLAYPKGTRRRLWGLAFFAGLGLSMLAKGPVGVVLTLLPLSIWIVWRKKIGLVLRSFPWVTGTLLCIAITLPWYMAAESRNPGFLRYFFIGENFKRFMVSGWKGDRYGIVHNRPFGSIWLYATIVGFPWILLSFGAFRWLKKRHSIFGNPVDNEWNDAFTYAVLWFLSPVLLFTFARNILITYMLPGVPGFAMATCLLLNRCLRISDNTDRPWFLRSKSWAISVTILPVVLFFLGIPILRVIDDSKSYESLVRAFQKNNTISPGELFFYRHDIPFSAQFYSNGKAYNIQKQDYPRWMRELSDNDTDFYVTSTNELKNIRPDVLSRIVEVAHFGHHILYKDIRINGETARKPLSIDRP
jgi:4-amino-4-deoxy-L-arabinose transferase-like glycosyltransferase